MSNLQQCKPETRNGVYLTLVDPTVSKQVKAHIYEGLERDCIDAERDAKLVAEVLSKVANDILYK